LISRGGDLVSPHPGRPVVDRYPVVARHGQDVAQAESRNPSAEDGIDAVNLVASDPPCGDMAIDRCGDHL